MPRSGTRPAQPGLQRAVAPLLENGIKTDPRPDAENSAAFVGRDDPGAPLKGRASQRRAAGAKWISLKNEPLSLTKRKRLGIINSRRALLQDGQPLHVNKDLLTAWVPAGQSTRFCGK